MVFGYTYENCVIHSSVQFDFGELELQIQGLSIIFVIIIFLLFVRLYKKGELLRIFYWHLISLKSSKIKDLHKYLPNIDDLM